MNPNLDPTTESQLSLKLKSARNANEAAALLFPFVQNESAFVEIKRSESNFPYLEILDLNDNFWALTLGKQGNPANPIVYAKAESQFRKYLDGIYQPISEGSVAGELLDNLALCLLTPPKNLKIATLLQQKNRLRMKSIVERAKELLAVDQSFFREQQPYHLAFQNGVLNFDTMTFEPLSPTYPLRSTLPVKYDPNAKCDKFIQYFLQNVLTADDLDLLQRYASQILEGINHSQTILILTGDAGWGKSSVMKILGNLLGWSKVGIIREQLYDNDNEIAHYANKHLLYHPDMPTQFLERKEASIFKQLVGGDPIWADGGALADRLTLEGRYPVILACNGKPKIHIDQDTDAWMRRLVVLKFKTPGHEQHLGKLSDLLLKNEGSGIVNWLLEGRRKLFKDKLQLTQTQAQKQRAATLLMASESPSVFVRSCVVKKKGGVMGKADLYRHYEKWCRKMAIQPFLYKEFHQAAKPVIEVSLSLQLRHDLVGSNGKARRGWVGMEVLDTKAVAGDEIESSQSVENQAA
jgi:P4 family phage/plasmid primase-like protien